MSSVAIKQRPLYIECAALGVSYRQLNKADLRKCYAAICHTDLPVSWKSERLIAALERDAKDTVAAAKEVQKIYDAMILARYGKDKSIDVMLELNTRVYGLGEAVREYEQHAHGEECEKKLLAQFPADEKSLHALAEQLDLARTRLVKPSEERYGMDDGTERIPAVVQRTFFRLARTYTSKKTVLYTNISYDAKTNKIHVKLAHPVTIDGCEVASLTLRPYIREDADIGGLSFRCLSGGKPCSFLTCTTTWSPHKVYAEVAGRVFAGSGSDNKDVDWVNPQYVAPAPVVVVEAKDAKVPAPIVVEAKEAKVPAGAAAAFDDEKEKARIKAIERDLLDEDLHGDFGDHPSVAAAPGDAPRPLKIEAAALYVDLEALTKPELCQAYTAIVGKTLPKSWDKAKMAAKLAQDVRDTAAAAKTLKQMFKDNERIDYEGDKDDDFGARYHRARSLHVMSAHYAMERIQQARLDKMISQFPTDEKSLMSIAESLRFVRYRVTEKGKPVYMEESGYHIRDDPSRVRWTPFRVGRVVNAPNVARFTRVRFKAESKKLVIDLANACVIDHCKVHSITLRLSLGKEEFSFVPLSEGEMTACFGCLSSWHPTFGVIPDRYPMSHEGDYLTKGEWVNPEYKARVVSNPEEDSKAVKRKVVNPEEEADDDEEDNMPITQLKRLRKEEPQAGVKKPA